MTIFINIIKGFVTGMAVMIPGVSAGSMVMSMGMYRSVLTLISGSKEQRKSTLPGLIPFGVGILAGIVVFAFLLIALLDKFPLQTSMVFIGMILGGIPSLYRIVKGVRINVKYAVSFLVAVCVMAGMLILSHNSNMTSTLEPSVLSFLIAVFLGFVAAATMVVPGISGSALMLILGYYYEITGSIKELAVGLGTFQGKLIGQGAFVIIPFAIGAVAGIVLVSKVIRRLLDKAPVTTSYALIGLMAASPAAVLLKVSVDWSAIGWLGYLIAVLCLVGGFTVAYYFGRADGQTKIC